MLAELPGDVRHRRRARHPRAPVRQLRRPGGVHARRRDRRRDAATRARRLPPNWSTRKHERHWRGGAVAVRGPAGPPRGDAPPVAHGPRRAARRVAGRRHDRGQRVGASTAQPDVARERVRRGHRPGDAAARDAVARCRRADSGRVQRRVRSGGPGSGSRLPTARSSTGRSSPTRSTSGPATRCRTEHGRRPGDGEVWLSAMLADELGADVGDVLSTCAIPPAPGPSSGSANPTTRPIAASW